MIEKKFIQDIVKQYQLEAYLSENLRNVGFSSAVVHKTPLGEKVIITASRPGLIVGRKGENIQKLTKALKSRFNLENPQIEIVEIEQPMLDPLVVAERIASTMERFGLSKFKGIGHKMLADVMGAGAKGVEIIISGKIPSSRAKRWRFYQGYLKKSGDIAVSYIRKAHTQAKLKTGVVGIQVKIMPPDLVLPDTVVPIEEFIEKSESSSESKSDSKEAKKTEDKKSSTKKGSSSKKSAQKKDEVKKADAPKADETAEAVKETDVDTKDVFASEKEKVDVSSEQANAKEEVKKVESSDAKKDTPELAAEEKSK
ncbi:MAG: 30S ribosomal protein S3 [Candidatus Woesearchaeota archaeon]